MEQQQQQHRHQESCVPPGFRFHPTEEELVAYYLTRKVASQKIDLDIIQEVDLYRIEPWDLQERCRYGGDEQTPTEWYFFSFKDRKYPSGTRTNRATAAGFWKATGRDKPVLSSRSRVIGMRKTLVFYKGRAPHGCKSDWIMHEYRLQTNEHAPTQEEGWVVCRAFQKPVPSQNHRPFVFPPSSYGAAAPGYYDLLPRTHVHGGEQHHYLAGGGMSASFFPGPVVHYSGDHHQDLLESKKPSPYLLSIPQLIESPSTGDAAGCLVAQNDQDGIQQLQQGQGQAAAATAIDWNFLDSLLSTSSQLHHDESTLYLQ